MVEQLAKKKHAEKEKSGKAAKEDKDKKERVAAMKPREVFTAAVRQAMRETLRQRHDLRHGICKLIGADYDWLQCMGYRRSQCWSGEALREAHSICATASTCATAMSSQQVHDADLLAQMPGSARRERVDPDPGGPL